MLDNPPAKNYSFPIDDLMYLIESLPNPKASICLKALLSMLYGVWFTNTFTCDPEYPVFLSVNLLKNYLYHYYMDLKNLNVQYKSNVRIFMSSNLLCQNPYHFTSNLIAQMLGKKGPYARVPKLQIAKGEDSNSCTVFGTDTPVSVSKELNPYGGSYIAILDMKENILEFNPWSFVYSIFPYFAENIIRQTDVTKENDEFLFDFSLSYLTVKAETPSFILFALWIAALQESQKIFLPINGCINDLIDETAQRCPSTIGTIWSSLIGHSFCQGNYEKSTHRSIAVFARKGDQIYVRAYLFGNGLRSLVVKDGYFKRNHDMNMYEMMNNTNRHLTLLQNTVSPNDLETQAAELPLGEVYTCT